MSRRPFVTAALAALAGASLLLAGCAADASGDETTDASSALPAAEGSVEYPLTLETAYGETELTERPTRIAAVSRAGHDLELLASLDVVPVAANMTGDNPWATDVIGDDFEWIFDDTQETGYPMEAIAAVEPDLIIALGDDLTGVYDQLASIAPVLAPEEPGVQDHWTDNMLAVGEALDLQDAAQAAVDDYDAWVESFQAEHDAFQGLTSSYLVYYGADGGLQYFSAPGTDPELALTSMGFAENPLAEQFDYRQEVSDELVTQVDADVVIISDNSDGGISAVVDQPLFGQLQAAQDDHVLLITNTTTETTEGFSIDGEDYEGNLAWALARSGPLSTPWAAERLAPHVEALLG